MLDRPMFVDAVEMFVDAVESRVCSPPIHMVTFLSKLEPSSLLLYASTYIQLCLWQKPINSMEVNSIVTIV